MNTYKAVDVAIETPDTLIEVNDDNIITNIPQRKFFRRGQTPQAFDLDIIKTAHKMAFSNHDLDVTDDCGLVLKYNLCDIYVVKGDDFNHKITYPIDVAIADKLFQLKNMNMPKQDMRKLHDKIIVVFGASKGIGEAIVRLAQKYHAKVYGFSRTTGVDVCHYQEVKQALEKVKALEGRIDCIINTAGILRMGLINCRKIEDIFDEINTNYIGCINIAQLSYSYLKETCGSLIFFTSSSYTRGRALYAVYSSTKTAIVNLVQSLSEEWEKDKIKVNAINPERTATPMRFENFGNEPEETLLSPQKVAEKTLETILTDYTGQIVDIKLKRAD